MNLQPEVLEQINYRINQEEISSRLYKSISVFLDNQGYIGAAKLFNQYSKEELAHAEFSYNYLSSLSILASLRAISAPTQDFKSLENVIKLRLKHESEITVQCNNFAKVCLEKGDMITFTLAQKYCNEQVEEMDKANKWMDRILKFGTSDVAMRLLDQKMGEAV